MEFDFNLNMVELICHHAKFVYICSTHQPVSYVTHGTDYNTYCTSYNKIKHHIINFIIVKGWTITNGTYPKNNVKKLKNYNKNNRTTCACFCVRMDFVLTRDTK
eukprot:1162991_1